MIKVTEKSYRKGTLVLSEVQFDHVFKRTVMRSGRVGKVYLPKELIGKNVYIVVDMNGFDVPENGGTSGQTQTP